MERSRSQAQNYAINYCSAVAVPSKQKVVDRVPLWVLNIVFPFFSVITDIIIMDHVLILACGLSLEKKTKLVMFETSGTTLGHNLYYMGMQNGSKLES